MLQGLLDTDVAARPPGSVDPFFSSVVLLMGFEDVDGSVTAPGMTDESPSAHGTASQFTNPGIIDTAQFKFGSSSLNLVNVDSGIFFSSSTDWDISTTNADPFTIETWFRYSTVVTLKQLLNRRGLFTTTFHFDMRAGATASEFSFGWSLDGDFSTIQRIETSGAGLTTGQFYHLCVDKDATGKIRLYVDGVMKGSSTPASSVIWHPAVGNVLCIGTNTAGAAAQLGWHDEVRITKGVARYASDSGFTPPTSRFPRS